MGVPKGIERGKMQESIMLVLSKYKKNSAERHAVAVAAAAAASTAATSEATHRLTNRQAGRRITVS